MAFPACPNWEKHPGRHPHPSRVAKCRTSASALIKSGGFGSSRKYLRLTTYARPAPCLRPGKLGLQPVPVSTEALNPVQQRSGNGRLQAGRQPVPPVGWRDLAPDRTRSRRTRHRLWPPSIARLELHFAVHPLEPIEKRSRGSKWQGGRTVPTSEATNGVKYAEFLFHVVTLANS